jgi:hypothetical protein
MSSNKSISKSNTINIPFLELYNAMERGDILYPANQNVTVDNSSWMQTGKKRKRPEDIDNVPKGVKKTRYD